MSPSHSKLTIKDWYEKCIIEYYEDPLNQEYSTEFYYMEEMDSDDEILNEACKLFHLNKENFEKIGETDY